MACFVVGTLLVPASVAAQEVGYKDLTREDPNPLKHKKFVSDSSCKGVSGGAGGSFDCPRKTYPFQLLLLSVDPSEIQVSGEVIAILRLRNVGHDPALVPWATDPDQIELPDDNGTFDFVEADFAANIVPDGGDARAHAGYVQIPVHLYGAKEVPGSLQEVRPGEYVELAIRLVLDCKTEMHQCQSLEPGSARLSFTWTELDSRETYKKCGTESNQTEIRQLTSDAAAIRVGEITPSQ